MRTPLPRRVPLALAAPALLAAHAAAQPVLYGVTGGGTLVRIDTATGAGTLVGASGFGCNAAAADAEGRILTGGGAGALADQIVAIDPATGAGSIHLNTVGRPVGYGIRGMAICPASPGTLYVVLSQASTTVIDTLASIDLATGVYTVLGPTGRTDLQALMCTPDSVLYALGINSGGQLFVLNPTTAGATVVGGGSFGGDNQAIDFVPGLGGVAARDNLVAFDVVTAAATPIGPIGIADLRGLAVVTPAVPPPPACYPNCDGSTQPPVLNVQDFSCFLTRYAAGESYANCDGSTQAPVLNVQDFSCFLTAYAAGCR